MSYAVYHRRYVAAVLKRGNRVIGVVTRDLDDRQEFVFGAVITIDATHEGDLLPLAAVKFRLGREPRTPEAPHAGRSV